MNMTSFAAASVAVRIGIFLAVLLAASLWRIFKKAGRPGWPALVPFYNGYITVEIAGKPGWWILLYLVPIVDIVVAAIVNVELARKFGKSTGFGVGLLLLPFIFYPMLADGDAAYVVADAADGSGGTTVPGRRGALLSASLIWFLASAVIGTVAFLVTLFSHSLSVAGGSTALPVFLNVVVLIGLFGIWKWRKWGVYLFFLADLMMVAVSMRVSLMAAPAYRMTVPGLLLVLAGEALLLALFAWAVWRAWSSFDVVEEPHLAIKTPAGMAAAAGTGRVEVYLSGDREKDMARFGKLAFKGEIIRFLTSERTKSYEQQSGGWWSREDLKLVVVKKYSSDFAPDVLFREAETAIDELARQGEIVGTPSGYRAK